MPMSAKLYTFVDVFGSLSPLGARDGSAGEGTSAESPALVECYYLLQSLTDPFHLLNPYGRFHPLDP